MISNYNDKRPFSDTITQRGPDTWSDFDMSFLIHPVKKDISPLRDIDAISFSVRNLILTNFYEAPFNPRRGGNLISQLFEPASNFTILSIKDSILRVLVEFEPRITNIDVTIKDESDRNAYLATVSYSIRNVENTSAETSFYIQRLR
jgi:phage baseplate assembly protein W